MYFDISGLKDNPNKRSNFFSQLTFGWVIKIFIKRIKRQITLQDLFKPVKSDESARLGSQLEHHWENELERARLKNEKPKLIRALNKLFYKKSIICGVMLLIYSLISIIQPMLLAELLILISNSKHATKEERRLKFIYGGVIAIVNLIRLFIYNHQLAFHFLLGMRARIACSSLLYRKVLRLSHSSISKITAGQLVNFLSNDATRFDFGAPWMHYFWIMPIQVVVGTCMIWYQVGISSLAGVIVMFIITIPVQGFLGKLSSKFRLKVANRSDVRVKHMTELINGIQVIKMYAWEIPFEKIIQALRKFEVKAIRYSSILKSVYLSLIVFTDRVSLFATIACYVLLGHYITADRVFSLAQFFNVMQVAMAIGFPLAVNMGAEALVSIRRFEEYLILHEKEASKIEEPTSSQYCISLNRIYAAWTPNEWRLSNVSLNIPHGSLCVIVGSVGSGKSSILHLFLGELIPLSGTIHEVGEISYASQEPWLFVGSVRENILFGKPYIRERYREVVRVCALEKDFQLFPYGDKTLVGERGVALSGGQRARINLARAVYRQADIYLLDDPLSAVDTHVSKHLFQECISGYLRKKTRILVTHQLQFLNKADIIVVVDEGQIICQGTYQELSRSNLDIKQLLHIEKESNEPEPKESVNLDRKNSTVSNASTVLENVEMDAHDEEMGASRAIFWPYFRASGHICKFITLVILLLVAQGALNASDLFLTAWISEVRDSYNNQTEYNTTEIVFHELGQNETTEKYRNITYHAYNTTTNDTYSEHDNVFLSNDFYIYTGLIASTVILTFIRSIWFMLTCMRTSINLHNKMFNCLMKTVMRFFDNNPSGRILNRFSKDMGTMDEILPKTMLEAIQVMLVMTGILIVIIITNVFMAVAIVILILIGYNLARIYTKTAKDIKRLEGITKSPVFSHVKASYDGLTTIRSSSAETHYINEFDLLQDIHTSSWYLTIATRTAFGLYIDFFTVIFITVVIFSFVLLNEVNDIFDASKAGLAISQAMILTGMVQLGSQQATEVVNQMMSVERILEYTNLEKESFDDKGFSLNPNWPSQGYIKFKNMFLRYQLADPPVLKNLNFSILPGQKVGIVGRTGAGKSSIISALFLLSTIEGNIYIDSVDTKQVPLNILRSKISIIPQKPVLFSSSVRKNLDPFDEYKDEDIWSAIREVEMKSNIPSLDYEVNEGGINFSVGQRQLLCLARAILRNNKILVLDEATANVDHQTDALIQSTIRRKFGKCTVLTIAHRLNTIMDSDIIFVMHAGELVESGHPHKLLQNFNGYFFKLVADNEESEARRLHSIANQTYLSTLDEAEEVTTL